MIAYLDGLYIRTRPVKALKRLASYAFFEGRPLTTRGRWINPLVFGLLSLGGRMPRLREVRKPVFIIGTGRSGTTVLGKVLSMHRDVGYLNEPKAMWHWLYPQEDIIGSYTRGPALYRLGAAQASEETVEKARRLYGFFLAATCSKRVVDKYPELIFRVPFVKALFPDARFLLLVRNGWDSCRSVEGWSKRFGTSVGGQRHDWWGADDRKWKLLVEQIALSEPPFNSMGQNLINLSSHADRAAVEWVLSMKEGLRLLGRMPGDLLLVRFERLTREPENCLREIAAFCELPDDRKFLEYGRRILSPLPAREPFDMSPAIFPAFAQTMRALGYEV